MTVQESIAANGNDLQKKLQEALDTTRITLVEIARQTGISKENIYKWYRGTKPSDSLQYLKLIKFLEGLLDISEQPLSELTANFSLMNDPGGEYISRRELTILQRLPLRQPYKLQPAVQPRGGAGSIVSTTSEPELIVNRIDAPFLCDILGVVDVVGANMEPTLQNGSRVAIAAVYDWNILEWGKCYFVIDKNWQSMIVRLYPGEHDDAVKLLSDHADQQKYPPLLRTWTQIEAIFKVKTYLLNL